MKVLFAACVLSTWGLHGGGSATSQRAARMGKDPAVGVGYLDIASEPSGAKLLIDDRDTGKTTPQAQVPLPAGHHKLVLIAPSGVHRTFGFMVEAGQTTRLTVHLAS